FLVGISGHVEKRLRKLGIMAQIPSINITDDRTEALRQAVNYVDSPISRSNTFPDITKSDITNSDVTKPQTMN
ncbi:MAG: hypothetical protein AAFQ14_20535, partial [Cyanobacteria bacterium J06621_12]